MTNLKRLAFRVVMRTRHHGGLLTPQQTSGTIISFSGHEAVQLMWDVGPLVCHDISLAKNTSILWWTDVKSKNQMSTVPEHPLYE